MKTFKQEWDETVKQNKCNENLQEFAELCSAVLDYHCKLGDLKPFELIDSEEQNNEHTGSRTTN